MGTERRVAVVTGAARGIGEAIALRLGRDGLAVVAWDLNLDGADAVARSILEKGGDAFAAAVDVSDSAAVRAAGDEVMSRYERLDVLVNNAGWDRISLFLESDERDWDRIIGVNFRAVLNTCRYLGPRVTEAEHGRIINIASDTAKIGGALEAVYSGAKGGVVSFSRALARELAATGTTVNVVNPGATDTPLFREVERELAGDPRFNHFFSDGLVAAVLKQIPLGRLGKPSDLSNMVSFLAQPSAEFITGQVVSVSGGQTMY